MIFDKIIKLIEMEKNHWESILNDKFVNGIVEVTNYMERSKIIQDVWDGLKSRIFMSENINIHAYTEIRQLSQRCENIINR